MAGKVTVGWRRILMAGFSTAHESSVNVNGILAPINY